MNRVQAHSELDYKDLLSEFQTTKRKLDNKVEALLAISQEFGNLQEERDQLRVKLKQTETKCLTLKKSLKANAEIRASVEKNSDCQRESLMDILNKLNEENKQLKTELDLTSSRLSEAVGDVKVLRQQHARHQLKHAGIASVDIVEEIVSKNCGTSSSVGCSKQASFEVDDSDKKCVDVDLLSELERVKQQHSQLEGDLRTVLSEKEELVIERDAYKNKAERLNKEMAYILSGDEKRVTDVDAIIMENRYLKDQLNHAREEASLAKVATHKYKNMLEKRKKLPKDDSSVTTTLLTKEQVEELLRKTGQNNDGRDFKCANGEVDYQALSSALLDAVNDKMLALSHQRKANKILGARVSDLETRLKSLELAGSVSPVALSVGHFGNFHFGDRDSKDCLVLKETIGTQTSNYSNYLEVPGSSAHCDSDSYSDVPLDSPECGLSTLEDDEENVP